VFFPVDEWFPAFALTCLAEGLVVLPAFWRSRVEPARLLVLLVFANLATHPAVWFVFTQLFLVGTIEYVVAAEVWAVAAEAVFWWAVLPGVGLRRVAGVAVAANALSFVLGRVLQDVWPGLLELPG
jgi:hypothetical protein